MAFSKMNARRPHGVHWLNMESMGLFGEADSVTWPNSGQSISAQHATTASLHLPRVAPALRRQSPRAGSVVLKNETV
jgi:hypothetical protein